MTHEGKTGPKTGEPGGTQKAESAGPGIPQPIGERSPDPQQRILRIRSLVRKALKRAERTLGRRQEEYDDAGKAEWYRQIADSLMADLRAYPRGTGSSAVLNVHTRVTEQVKLNPKLDARENAELLYKKARKATRGREVIARRLAATRGEIAELGLMLEKVEELLRTADLPEIAPQADEFVGRSVEALRRLRVLPRETLAGQEGSRMAGVRFYHFQVQGYEVYAGRGATQNDELTTRFARPWDIWLHVAAHSGSHVVIRREKSAPWPPQLVIAQAASLAVWFSKAKHTSYAEVHVTEARFVRKRRKSPPGEVIAERCKTVRVAPRSPQELFSRNDDGS